MGTIIANGPKCTTRGETQVFPTNHDPIHVEMISFGFLGPPLFHGLKQNFYLGRGGGSHYPLPRATSSGISDGIVGTKVVPRANTSPPLG